MNGVLAISEAASLGLHAAAVLAADPTRRRSTAELAAAIGASEAHLAKVVRRLGRAGLVRSVRGPGGGSVLSRPAEQITLLEVYEAVEGPLPETRCLLAEPICDGHCCVVGGMLQSVARRMHDHLSRTKLSELLPCRPRAGKAGSLKGARSA